MYKIFSLLSTSTLCAFISITAPVMSADHQEYSNSALLMSSFKTEQSHQNNFFDGKALLDNPSNITYTNLYNEFEASLLDHREIDLRHHLENFVNYITAYLAKSTTSFDQKKITPKTTQDLLSIMLFVYRIICANDSKDYQAQHKENIRLSLIKILKNNKITSDKKIKPLLDRLTQADISKSQASFENLFATDPGSKVPFPQLFSAAGITRSILTEIFSQADKIVRAIQKQYEEKMKLLMGTQLAISKGDAEQVARIFKKIEESRSYEIFDMILKASKHIADGKIGESELAQKIYKLGTHFLSQEQWDWAIFLLKNAYASNHPMAKDLLGIAYHRYAKILYAQHKIDESLYCFIKASKLGNPESSCSVGFTYIMMGKYIEAIPYLESVEEKDLSEETKALRKKYLMGVYSVFGNQLLKDGNYEQALRQYEKAARFDGEGHLNFLVEMFRIGINHEKDELWSSAIFFYEAAHMVPDMDMTPALARARFKLKESSAPIQVELPAHTIR